MVSGSFSYSQKGWGAGACGIYNASSDIGGIGARVLIPVKSKIYAVPYAYYYFYPRDFSGGLSAMWPFYKYDVFTFYGVASATFSGSVSVTVNDSTVSKSSEKKADSELGAGVLIGDGCIKGLFEPRYAVVNNVFTIRAGFVYFFKCKSKHNARTVKKRWQPGDYSNTRQRTYCPAFD